MPTYADVYCCPPRVWSACPAGLSAAPRPPAQPSLRAPLCTRGPRGRPRTRRRAWTSCFCPAGAPAPRSAWIPPGEPPGPAPSPAHPGLKLPAPPQVQVLCPHGPSASSAGPAACVPRVAQGLGQSGRLPRGGDATLCPNCIFYPLRPRDTTSSSRHAQRARQLAPALRSLCVAQLPACPRDTDTHTHGPSAVGKWAPFTGTSSTHRHKHRRATPNTHTHTHTHTVNTHRHKHRRATPKTHTHTLRTGVGKAGSARSQATSLGPGAGGGEREAGESAPGRKRGENGSACQGVTREVARRRPGNQERP